MSMEIAVREALDAEAGAIINGDSPELEERLERAWNSNDGDAFAESLAEARRLAVLDMPQRRGRRGRCRGYRRSSPARSSWCARATCAPVAPTAEGHAAGLRGFPGEEPGRRGAVEEFSEAASVGATATRPAASARSSSSRSWPSCSRERAVLDRRAGSPAAWRRSSSGSVAARQRYDRPRTGSPRSPAVTTRGVPDDGRDREPGRRRDRARRRRRQRDRREHVRLDRRLQRDARAARGPRRRALAERRHRLVRFAADGRDPRRGGPGRGRDRLRGQRRRPGRRASGADGRVHPRGGQRGVANGDRERRECRRPRSGPEGA